MLLSIMTIPSNIITSGIYGFHYLCILANTFFFLIVAILLGMKWFCVLICITLIISDELVYSGNVVFTFASGRTKNIEMKYFLTGDAKRS